MVEVVVVPEAPLASTIILAGANLHLMFYEEQARNEKP